MICIKLSSYELQISMTHLKHRNVETLFERRIALFASRTYSGIINRIKKNNLTENYFYGQIKQNSLEFNNLELE